MNKIKLAYLAPEIPALSATFVYNEIFQLEQLGYAVVPFSVHRPGVSAADKKLADLEASVFYLYAQKKHVVLKDNVLFLLKHPLRYLITLKTLLSDMFKVGVLSRTAMGLAFRFFYSVILAKQLLKTGVQHIHVHFAHVPADIAMYAASLSGISFSVTAHANDLFERAWLLPEKVDRAKFFVTISEFNREFLRRQGCDVDQVAVVRCGADVEYFNCRKKPGMSDVPKIGFIGRLVEKKGADDLLLAANELKKMGMNFKLAIAGSGPLEGHLIELARKLGLSDGYVSFVGPIAHSAIPEFLSELDVFVLPCKQDRAGDMDGIPVVLMEAMLSGVSVISTRLSGIPELVVDRETGLLVEPGNKIQLANAIQALIEDEALTKQLNMNAVSKVKKEFNLRENAAQLTKLFDKYLVSA
jgi:colanic acid/amylovoran biosynthesis glycosyltransferase